MKHGKKIISKSLIGSAITGSLAIPIVAQACTTVDQNVDLPQIITAINELSSYDGSEINSLATSFLDSINGELSNRDEPLVVRELLFSDVNNNNIFLDESSNTYIVTIFNFLGIANNTNNQTILMHGDIVTNSLIITILNNNGRLTLTGINIGEEAFVNTEDIIFNENSGIQLLSNYSSVATPILPGLAGQAIEAFNILTLDETVTSITMPTITSSNIRYANFTSAGITAQIVIPSSSVEIVTDLSSNSSFEYNENIIINIVFSSTGSWLINQNSGIDGVTFTSQFQSVLLNETNGIEWLSLNNGYNINTNTPPINTWAEGIITGINNSQAAAGAVIQNFQIDNIENSDFRYSNGEYIVSVFQNPISGVGGNFFSNGEIIDNYTGFFEPITLTISDSERASFVVNVSNLITNSETIQSRTISGINDLMNYDSSTGNVLNNTAADILNFINGNSADGFASFNGTNIFSDSTTASTITFSTPINITDLSVSNLTTATVIIPDINITSSDGSTSYSGAATITINFDSNTLNPQTTVVSIVSS